MLNIVMMMIFGLVAGGIAKLLMFTRIVVPVSTRSTTASARPNPHAASTEPETYLMPRKKILQTGK